MSEFEQFEPALIEPMPYRKGGGAWTLFKKEILRFWRVSFQTIAAPVITALLYLLIFSHVLEGRLQVHEVNYSSFLIPGLIMMSMLQNAFANSASSLIQSKVMGNLIFILLTPISYFGWFVAFLAAAVVRGLVIGFFVYLVSICFLELPMQHPSIVVGFALLGCSLLGVFGIIAGLWAEKFDQMAAFQNFVIMPLSFLSGVFYSIHSLPQFWQRISHLNPFFYLIDGFRYGFLGVSDVSPWLSLAITGLSVFLLSGLALLMLKSGYKVRG